MVNTYVFEDWPVKLCQENFDDGKKKMLELFKQKYPELINRLEIINNELMFVVSEHSEISEHNWVVDFLESNANNERPYNGLGKKLEDEFYADLYTLFANEDYDGDVYFASSSDKCIVETVGKFDSRYSFKLKEDGLHWTDEEE
jgi:hypothetical protein